MANILEQKKLKSGVEFQVDNQKVEHLRSVDGAQMNLPQVNATTADSKNVEYTTGRVSYSDLEITFANADKNFAIIEKCVKYMDNPMASPRMTLAIDEIVRDGKTKGSSVVLNNCFPTEIELPKADNDAGTLETRIRFSVHYVETKAGGIN